MLVKVASGLIATVALWLSVSTNSDSHSAIARFREVEVSYSTLGAFAGSTEVWKTRILITHSTRVIGIGIYACVRVDFGPSLRRCAATYRLPEGEIELAGLISTRSRFSLVIVGATGVYKHDVGTIAIQVIGHHPRSALVTFYLD